MAELVNSSTPARSVFSIARSGFLASWCRRHAVRAVRADVSTRRPGNRLKSAIPCNGAEISTGCPLAARTREGGPIWRRVIVVIINVSQLARARGDQSTMPPAAGRPASRSSHARGGTNRPIGPLLPVRTPTGPEGITMDTDPTGHRTPARQTGTMATTEGTEHDGGPLVMAGHRGAPLPLVMRWSNFLLTVTATGPRWNRRKGGGVFRYGRRMVNRTFFS